MCGLTGSRSITIVYGGGGHQPPQRFQKSLFGAKRACYSVACGHAGSGEYEWLGGNWGMSQMSLFGGDNGFTGLTGLTGLH